MNSLSVINQNREILPKKKWNYFGRVLKCRTPSGRAFLTLYNPSHKIRRCQGTYCVHFSLFYTNVQFCTLFVNFWSCTLMYTLGTLNYSLGPLFCCFITLFGAGGTVDPPGAPLDPLCTHDPCTVPQSQGDPNFVYPDLFGHNWGLLKKKKN